MKTKRLNRDLWGFQHYPYYQMVMDNAVFQGFVSVILLTDGEPNFWDFEKAGKAPVTGGGMVWLQCFTLRKGEGIILYRYGMWTSLKNMDMTATALRYIGTNIWM